jgi:hypothetical protein
MLRNYNFFEPVGKANAHFSDVLFVGPNWSNPRLWLLAAAVQATRLAPKQNPAPNHL